MARSVGYLGAVVGAALAAAAFASAVWAGDRYSAYDDQDGGYAGQAYGGPAGGYDARYRDDRAGYDQRQGDRTRSYSRRDYSDVEAVDPCAAQEHMIGHGCRPGAGEVERQRFVGQNRDAERFGEADEGYGRDDEGRGRYERRFDDVEAVDPCAVQARAIGRGCRPDAGSYDQRGWREDRKSVV